MVAIGAWSPQGNGRSGEFYYIYIYISVMEYYSLCTSIFILHDVFVTTLVNYCMHIFLFGIKIAK